MINCDGGYVTAFLDQDVGRTMYSDLLVGTAAAATPTGQARRVTGGYRVSGHFPFASGCRHCEWVWLGCVVVDDETPRVDGNGVPEIRQCLVKLAQCEILDTWYATGLRGTGSNDLLVDDVFVEAEHTFSFRDVPLIKRLGPLYAFPFMFVAKVSTPALGVARQAVDALIDMAAKKPARRYTVGERLEPPKMMRDDVFVQEAVGRAETMLTAARAYQFEVIGDLWTTLVNGCEPTPTQVARFTTAPTHIIGACVDVVQLACKAAGGAAVYEKGPFDRCLRDVLTMNQHVVGTLRTYEMGGRLLLGLEPVSQVAFLITSSSGCSGTERMGMRPSGPGVRPSNPDVSRNRILTSRNRREIATRDILASAARTRRGACARRLRLEQKGKWTLMAHWLQREYRHSPLRAHRGGAQPGENSQAAGCLAQLQPLRPVLVKIKSYIRPVLVSDFVCLSDVRRR
jgi:alkylation response protein AidB-like acyl-CoA dehydrogenase